MLLMALVWLLNRLLVYQIFAEPTSTKMSADASIDPLINWIGWQHLKLKLVLTAKVMFMIYFSMAKC